MTNRAVAVRYARALFDVSVEAGEPERTAREIAAFQEMLSGHATLEAALLNPAISVGRKRSVVSAILDRSAEISAVVKRLVLMLAERDRLSLLPDLIETYEVLLMDHLGVVRARITTAEALAPEHVQTITSTLASATGRQVVIETSVDEDLLGGMITQIGSTVFDGSLANHLDRLRQRFQTST